MVYLDANLFVIAEVDIGAKGEEARSIIKTMIDKKFDGLTSVLTVDEVVWNIRKICNVEISVNVGKNMFELQNLKLVDAYSSTVLKSFEFTEKYGLKPMDAIHVATMLENGVKEIVSEDSDFKKVKEIIAYSFSEFLKKLK